MNIGLQRRTPEVVVDHSAPGRQLGAQVGETLMEVLIAIVLMTVAFSTILTGMMTSTKIAQKNQERTRANVVLTAAAERLLEPRGTFAYKPCAAANNGIADDNNYDDSWNAPWASYPGYTPAAEGALLPSGWRVRITDMRYLLGPNYLGVGKAFAPNADNVLVPQWSSWGTAGFYKCADLAGMNEPLLSQRGGQYRDGGLQQIKLAVEKPDGTGPHSYATVDEIILTKRDQRCPITNYSNADRGPC